MRASARLRLAVEGLGSLVEMCGGAVTGEDSYPTGQQPQLRAVTTNLAGGDERKKEV
jgi:hypothetical protein